jgi:hypothetical protein
MSDFPDGLPDFDEVETGDVELSIEKKAKRRGEVCGHCGEKIGEPVFFTTKRIESFGNDGYWRVPTCEDCGPDEEMLQFEWGIETVSLSYTDEEWKRKVRATHAEAECASCGRTCILDRDRKKFKKSWLKHYGERRTFCSQRCRVRHNNQKRSERLEEKRAGTECQECGDTSTPDRSDAKYCSAACKQRAYRKRKKSEA